MKPYEKLLAHWSDDAQGMACAGLDEAEVVGLERKYGITFPFDFRDFLLHCCPRSEEAGYDWPTSWWHFERIKNIPEEYEHAVKDEVIASGAAKYIFFADYAVWCMAWAICCDDGPNRGKIAVISGNDRFVTDSFGDFVDLYVKDDKSIL